MIHGGIFPQIEAVACAISAQVDDRPSSPFVAISSGLPAIRRARQRITLLDQCRRKLASYR
jgi:hypothetical protein